MQHLLAVVLLGAAMVVAGGCASSGQAGAGSSSSAGEQSVVPQFVDDSWISSKITAKFLADNRINAFDIGVHTRRGVVTLSGTVPSAAMAERAVAIARGTRGVKDVISKITVEPRR